MNRASLVLVALLVATAVAQESARQPGVVELPRAVLAADAKGGVKHAVAPIFVLQADGRPLLSEAGMVQLADEGPGFYYGALNADRVGYARSVGMLGTNNWGDVESMCLAGRVVAKWRTLHPDVRLGIDEISGRWGGFPDYDGDGISDHLTHQVGININFLVPCRKQPERYIHHGVANEDLFDQRLFIDLVDVLVDEGALWMTTNRSAFAPGAELSSAGSRHLWKELDRRPDGYSSNIGIGARPVRMTLLSPKGDHGDHVNAVMQKGEL